MLIGRIEANASTSGASRRLIDDEDGEDGVDVESVDADLAR